VTECVCIEDVCVRTTTECVSYCDCVCVPRGCSCVRTETECVCMMLDYGSLWDESD
jgi:hypothetical protein